MRQHTKNIMLSILIPACNEQNRISTTLQEYMDHFGSNYADSFEIVVVCNGCTDRTREICADYARRYPQVRISSFDRMIGKGGAIIEGFKICKGDIVSFVDADGATGPAELDKLARELADCDCTIGSRWLPESNILTKQPLPRRIASRGFNVFANTLLGLDFRDTQCGAKAFRREPLEATISEVTTTGFAFDVDLLYQLRRKRYNVKEVAVTWASKDHSTLALRKAVPAMFLTVVRLRMSHIL